MQCTPQPTNHQVTFYYLISEQVNLGSKIPDHQVKLWWKQKSCHSVIGEGTNQNIQSNCYPLSSKLKWYLAYHCARTYLYVSSGAAQGGCWEKSVSHSRGTRTANRSDASSSRGPWGCCCRGTPWSSGNIWTVSCPVEQCQGLMELLLMWRLVPWLIWDQERRLVRRTHCLSWTCKDHQFASCCFQKESLQ